MARYKSSYSLEKAMAQDVYHFSYTREELLDIRYTLAHATNTRLWRLEKGKSTVTGESYAREDGGAYAESMIILKSQNRKRFSESPIMSDYNRWDLLREITQLQGILGMKSSTVKGWREIEEKRINSFIAKGVPENIARNPEFYKMLSSENYKTLTKGAGRFPSDQIIDFLTRDSLPDDAVEILVDSFNQFLKSKRKGDKSLKRLDMIFTKNLKKK